jgi:hypothetical protein
MAFKSLFAALVLACGSTLATQDVQHAPTLETCVADVNLWTSEIPGWPNTSLDQIREGTNPLSVRVIQSRILSVTECSSAHPQLNQAKSGELAASSALPHLYELEMQRRLLDFLDRHGLRAKFTEEDEAGKR